MPVIRLWNDIEIPRMGLGCWAIGGPFFSGTMPLGYTGANDRESRRAIATGLDLGIRLFDTAAVYGVGHSERLLGLTVGNRHDVLVSTKLGPVFDEPSRQVLGEDYSPDYIARSIDASLRRLRRERIDLLFLHLNALPVVKAQLAFAALDEAVRQGKVGAYGWSTDFPENAAAVAGRDNFKAVEHCMNVFFDAASMLEVTSKNALVAFIRSPLAMGLLSGKFTRHSELPADDVRSNNLAWMDYFKDGRAAPALLAALQRVRDLLCSGGRTPAQGALGWLLAKAPHLVPLPGFRLAAQVEENVGALDQGALPADVMAAIEAAIARPAAGGVRER